MAVRAPCVFRFSALRPPVRGWPGRREQAPDHDDAARVWIDGPWHKAELSRAPASPYPARRTPVNWINPVRISVKSALYDVGW
jgi:hypothetical protein